MNPNKADGSVDNAMRDGSSRRSRADDVADDESWLVAARSSMPTVVAAPRQRNIGRREEDNQTGPDTGELEGQAG
jgi:hypothetical protein